MHGHQEAADLQKKLTSQGVEYCFASYVDIHGISKTKCVPISHLEDMARGSELFTVGALDGMGLIGPQFDECAAVPDLATATILPWDKRYCWFASDLHYHGEPYANSSRVILKKALEKAASKKLAFNVGIEPEFYVYRKMSDGFAPFQTEAFRGSTPAYDLDQTFLATPLLEQLTRYVDELGWGLYSFDQEGGHGQFEIDFGYADALTTADRLTFFRFMVKNVVRSFGAVASFMPKPFSSDFRSGAHHNMSLMDTRTNENLFDIKRRPVGELARGYGLEATDEALHFIGGLLDHAEALCAVTCPSYNSYKGLIARGDMPDMSWAPVLQAYGSNNRSAMLRLPMNRPCIENRTPDMSANFYLSTALSLHAGLYGLENRGDPGRPLNENLYLEDNPRSKGRNLRRLPRTLLEATEALEASTFARDAFGEAFVDIFVAQKKKEWEAQFYAVTPTEREQYLAFV
ncbi:glutamine synthetase [Rhodopseudomonas boonkerdii]|uniref:glutamine synthetase family protein n=1 Tax=Rhodopseudomonas boonkerdii TaxID=475937 RepID=UPI001E46A987|nr:glutamine synthetase family protein [Rhodopseudomonas boonkerdii]UGV25261.1 glutamine synthetase [Rhodopseudomonas boonkerdii]